MRFWKALLVPAATAAPTMAQLTYSGCYALNPSDFQMTELFNMKGSAGAAIDKGQAEPTRMDVRVVNKNGIYDHSDIYFEERFGNVKYYDCAARKVSLRGKTPSTPRRRM